MNDGYDNMNSKEIVSAERGEPDTFEDWLGTEMAAERLIELYMDAQIDVGERLCELPVSNFAGRISAMSDGWVTIDQGMDDAYQSYVASWEMCNG